MIKTHATRYTPDDPEESLSALAGSLAAKLDDVQRYCPVHVQDEIRTLVRQATAKRIRALRSRARSSRKP